MEAGDMIGATLQSITWQGLVYDWHTQRQGNASLYNTGLVEGDIPVIGPGDVLPASIIPGNLHPDALRYSGQPRRRLSNASDPDDGRKPVCHPARGDVLVSAGVPKRQQREYQC